MVLYGQQDPDVVRWGLHQLLPPPPDAAAAAAVPTAAAATTPCTAAYAPPPPLHRSISSTPSFEIKVEHVAHHHHDSVFDSDHTIAQALQEELSQVALAEASFGGGASAPSTAARHDHSAVLTQQWTIHVESGPPSPAHGNALAQGAAAPAPEPLLIELMEDFSVLDGQVGERLNDMVPVPHVPKTNGEIPSVDEAVSDHQRLLDR
ncbi:hypothetical protein U9M48_011257 [Paspalum notatum var. saurae]